MSNICVRLKKNLTLKIIVKKKVVHNYKFFLLKTHAKKHQPTNTTTKELFAPSKIGCKCLFFKIISVISALLLLLNPLNCTDTSNGWHVLQCY